MKLRDFLVYYFGLLQIPHLLLNFILIFFPQIAHGNDTYLIDVIETLRLNSFLDFIFTSPLGLIFLAGYIKKAKWTSKVGVIALVSAFINSLLYVYLLVSNNLFDFKLSNLIILLLFSPPIVLFFLTVFEKLKGNDYLSPKEY